DCSSFVILTDIVNTGGTLQGVIQYLTDHGKRDFVRLFSIAKMRNSPAEIGDIPLSSVVTVNRDFYPAKANECLLCQLGQPAHSVKTGEDFLFVGSEQLTPFDFWELVRDARALVENASDAFGRSLGYCVDTQQLL